MAAQEKSFLVIKEMSSDLRDPSVWGPKFWATYDIIAETYPKHPDKKERKAAIDFFHSQKYLIPCTTCAHNYQKVYRKYPPDVSSRKALKKWLLLLKEKVAEHVEKEKQQQQQNK